MNNPLPAAVRLSSRMSELAASWAQVQNVSPAFMPRASVSRRRNYLCKKLIDAMNIIAHAQSTMNDPTYGIQDINDAESHFRTALQALQLGARAYKTNYKLKLEDERISRDLKHKKVAGTTNEARAISNSSNNTQPVVVSAL